MTRRVVLGQQNDGSMGLRISALGVDAFVGDGQGGDFTFNSDWTDIAKIHAVGIATYSTVTVGGFWVLEATWPDLGYKPFVEIRRLIGSVVYDDWWIAAPGSGGGTGSGVFSANINSTGISLLSERIAGGTRPANFFVLYIAYKIAVPSQ